MFFVQFLLSIFATMVGSTEARTFNFPDGFLWGTATSAYQIEGGASSDNRSASIWDVYVREPGRVADNSTGDIAADSYHKYKVDVAMLADLGAKSYRFSISWSRVLPNGDLSMINEVGFNYYRNLVDELVARNITPVITLYHWDLPQILQDQGGWLSSESQKWFLEYAKKCFEMLPKVQHWITFNEIYIHAFAGHGDNSPFKVAPGFKSNGDWAAFRATHNMLLAHAHTYRAYKELGYTGFIGIANSNTNGEPLDPDSTEDKEAVKLFRDFNFGLFTEPMLTGNYPQSLINHFDNVSKKYGRTTNVIPKFTEEEKQLIKGSLDFLGINYYVTLLVTTIKPGQGFNWIHKDLGIYGTLHPERPKVGPYPNWIRIYPAGLHDILVYAQNQIQQKSSSKDMFIMITENGCMNTGTEGHNDTTRISFIESSIAAIALAIEKGVNLKGFHYWSLLDNFEWSKGYENKFGLYNVDFTSADRTRTPKKSKAFYEQIIKNNMVNINKAIEDDIKAPKKKIELTTVPPPTTTTPISQTVAPKLNLVLSCVLSVCLLML